MTVETIDFNHPDMNDYVRIGKNKDDDLRDFIRGAINVVKKKVEFKKHTIYSGPPGVGKSFGAEEELFNSKKTFIKLTAGMTDIAITVKIAYAVATLKNNEELVVLIDDADDIIWNDYKNLNKWKTAFAPETQFTVPMYNYERNINSTLIQLEKSGQQDVADALRTFMEPGSLGVQIPMSRVRFVILCNLDVEDPKVFTSKKLRSAVDPILDRFKYERIDLTWQESWGWLAHVLINSQPFEEDGYLLTIEQKKELLQYVWDGWKSLCKGNTFPSYRTIGEFAEDMINYPSTYRSRWDKKKSKRESE